MTSHTAVIGLEIHVQLNTRTKLFCGCAVAHDAKQNKDVCPVCLGLPGALPVVNERAVELAVRAAAMLGADVHRTSRFVRKNYFYPDLPKGYQITQLNEPIATGGMIRMGERTVRISRLHIEEDAGKLLHDRVKNCSAIDLNRCGIPLLEIVTEPELHNAAEAVRAAKELKRVMQYAAISDCDMELGSLRVDANVSLAGQKARGEIKNVNSFAHLERAINAEIERQAARLATGRGADVVNETVTWDEHNNALRVMRTKEERADYRYFDEPDLPALVIDEAMFEEAIADLPDAPHEVEARFAALGLPTATVAALTATRPLAEYFDDVSARGVSAHDAAAWILTHVLAWCNAHGCEIDAYPVQASSLANVVARVGAHTLTRDGARQVVKALEDGEQDIEAYIHKHGLAAATDDGRLNEWIDEVLSSENELVERYRGGESNLFGFLMGRLMKRAGTALDPRVASERLKERLDG